MAYKFRLESFKSHSGDSSIAFSNVTLVTGPNNSGKSTFLKNLSYLIDDNNRGNEQLHVVRELEVSKPEGLSDLTSTYPSCRVHERHGLLHTDSGISSDFLSSRSASTHPQHLSRLPLVFGCHLYGYLKSDTRLRLLEPVGTYENQAKSILHLLYQARQLGELELSALVREAFNRDVRLDYSTSKYKLRIGADLTDAPVDPRDQLEFFKQVPELSDQGDGVRAFLSVISAVILGQRDVFLIDEPELFLHPPQAYRLGRFIGQRAQLGPQFVVSTHSEDFIRGVLLEHGQGTSMLRLSREDSDDAQISPISMDQIRPFIEDPLLSSANIIQSLFHPKVVLVEGDSDVQFWNLAFRRKYPEKDVYFVSVGGKGAVVDAFRKLRDIGVNAIALLDADVLNNLDLLKKALADDQAISVIEPLQTQLEQICKASSPQEKNTKLQELLQEVSQNLDSLTFKYFDKKYNQFKDDGKPWQKVKQHGVNAFDEVDKKSTFTELVNHLKSFHIVVNQTGELESILVDCGVDYSTDKPEWLSKALRSLNSLDTTGSKEVWFLAAIIQEL